MIQHLHHEFRVKIGFSKRGRRIFADMEEAVNLIPLVGAVALTPCLTTMWMFDKKRLVLP